MWRTRYYCDYDKNEIRVWIRKTKLKRKEGIWSWLTEDEKKVFDKFTDKYIKRGNRIFQEEDSFKVNVSIGDNCLPVAKIKIFSKSIDPAGYQTTLPSSQVNLHITALVSIVMLLTALTIMVKCFKVFRNVQYNWKLHQFESELLREIGQPGGYQGGRHYSEREEGRRGGGDNNTGGGHEVEIYRTGSLKYFLITNIK